MWRAKFGALAVVDTLNSRGLDVDQMCKLCKNASVSMNHALYQCHPTSDMLQTVHFPPEIPSPRSLIDNFQIIMKILSDEAIEEKYRTTILWILWSIWKNHNSIMYSAFEKDKIWIPLNKKELTAESSTSALRVLTGWQQPRPRFVICNVNANWRNAGFMIGGAWISRDHQENVLPHSRDAFT